MQTFKNGSKIVLKENGLKYILNYKNDTLDGLYFLYLKDEIIQMGDFSMGFKNGTVKHYKDKYLYYEKTYEMGTLVSITNYNADGTLSFKKTYLKNKMFVIHYNYSIPMDSGWTLHNQKIYDGYIDTIEKIN